MRQDDKLVSLCKLSTQQKKFEVEKLGKQGIFNIDGESLGGDIMLIESKVDYTHCISLNT